MLKNVTEIVNVVSQFNKEELQEMLDGLNLIGSKHTHVIESLLKLPDDGGELNELDEHICDKCRKNVSHNVRMAMCAYGCKDSIKPSDSKFLPFFEAQPDREYDKYYCGCWGWE